PASPPGRHHHRAYATNAPNRWPHGTCGAKRRPPPPSPELPRSSPRGAHGPPTLAAHRSRHRPRLLRPLSAAVRRPYTVGESSRRCFRGPGTVDESTPRSRRRPLTGAVSAPRSFFVDHDRSRFVLSGASRRPIIVVACFRGSLRGTD